MQDSNLVKIYISFSKLEWKNYQKFINSPYFNTNPQIIKLADLIRKVILSGKPEILDKFYCYKKIYPGKAYNDALIRKMISLLNKLTEDFIVSEKLKRSDILSKRIHINEMSDRNLSEGYIKQVAQLKKMFSERKMDEEMYMESYQVEYLYSRLSSFDSIMYVKPHKQVLKHLFKFFSYSYFKITAYNLIREIFSGEEFEHHMLDELLTLCQSDSYKDEVPIQIFLEIVKLFLEGKEDKTRQFKKVDLFDFEKHLTAEDALFAYFFIQQFLIIQNQKGNPIPGYQKLKWKYYRKFYELFPILAASGIGQTAFGNIINAALSNNEISWIENFIQKYRTCLISDDIEAFWDTSYARINIAKNEFDHALSILSKSKPKTMEMKDLVKIYTLISLYELKKYDEVSNLILTYKKFLKNSSGSYPKLVINESSTFIIAAELVLKARFEVDQRKMEILEAKINKIFSKRIMFQKWLKSKLEEIIPSKKTTVNA